MNKSLIMIETMLESSVKLIINRRKIGPNLPIYSKLVLLSVASNGILVYFPTIYCVLTTISHQCLNHKSIHLSHRS